MWEEESTINITMTSTSTKASQKINKEEAEERIEERIEEEKEDEEEEEEEEEAEAEEEEEDENKTLSLDGKSIADIKKKIRILENNLPEREPGARKRPPKAKYTSIAHTFSDIHRAKGINLKDFKKKWGEIKVEKSSGKKKKNVVHPYMLRPEYACARKTYTDCLKQNALDRQEYKNTYPNAYKYWTEMRKITKLKNSIDPLIQEERRKKELAKKNQMDMDESENQITRITKRLKYIPDDVSRAMIHMERDINSIILKNQEEHLRQNADMQRSISLRFQQGYDSIIDLYKNGVMQPIN